MSAWNSSILCLRNGKQLSTAIQHYRYYLVIYGSRHRSRKGIVTELKTKDQPPIRTRSEDSTIIPHITLTDKNRCALHWSLTPISRSSSNNPQSIPFLSHRNRIKNSSIRTTPLLSPQTLLLRTMASQKQITIVSFTSLMVRPPTPDKDRD